MSHSASRIQEIFLKAIRLPSAERSRFLDQECAGDQKLLREVNQLIKHHFSKTILPRSADTMQNKVPGPGIRQLLHSLSTHSLARQFTTDRRKVLWAACVLFALLMVTMIVVRALLKDRIAFEMREGLRVIAERQVQGVKLWLSAEQSLIQYWARRPEVLESVTELNRLVAGPGSGDFAESPVSPGNTSGTQLPTPEENKTRIEQIQRRLLDSLTHLKSPEASDVRFAIWNLEGVLVADSTAPGLIGNRVTEYGATLLVKVFRGETTFWLPTRKGFITRGFEVSDYLDQPQMAIIAPVNDGGGKTIAAVLVAGLGLEQRFNELLAGIPFGESGETYAFDQDGYLLSATRFSPEFERMGLLDEAHAHAFWEVRIANPGVNLWRGEKPATHQDEWPLTRMAAAATVGRDGEDVQGYLDYRGVPVIGVWRWIGDFDFGLAVEVDVVHAFAAMNYILWAFVTLLGFTLLVPATVIWSAIKMSLRETELPRQLGAYALGDRIGEGGIGEVYRAEHAMLKRPTAVKVLKAEQVGSNSRVRFEREVRLAASLEHPNTIEIYDYGEDADGRLYYAMEFVDGLTISQLLSKSGLISAERTVYLLRQVCLSLREAHSRGLVHRDIKPQNIMVCCRGGEADVVKVLDFGLVKQFALAESASLTNSGVLVGTPMYISPERLRDPGQNDPQSDIYSLGVVAFEMLSGSAPFTEADPAAIMHDTMFTAPRELKMVVGVEIPRELTSLVMSCLSKSPAQRPASILNVIDALDQIQLPDPWTQTRARIWWKKYGTPSQVASLPNDDADQWQASTVVQSP